MTPAALSILTTSFTTARDRTRAIGAWSGTIPLVSAVGVLAGGLLAQGPGWRWVFFVNIPGSVVVIAAARRILPADRPRRARHDVDVAGAVLATCAMLLLVHALVTAPEVGWAAGRTIAELVAAAALGAGFVLTEQRRREPLFPLSIFRSPGLAAADATQVVAQAAFYSLFFFVTLYLQNVLQLSPIAAGAAYIPVTVCVAISSGIATQVLPRTGARALIVTGTLLGAGGIYCLSRIPAHGGYAADVLPGLIVMAVGLGPVFVGVQTAANADVPADKAGLAAALITTSSTLGGALGLAIFSAVATGRTQHLLAAHAAPPEALTAGFGRALALCSIFLVAAAAIATRTRAINPNPASADMPVPGPEPVATP